MCCTSFFIKCGRDREHVVCWAETSNTVSSSHNATCNAATQAAEDFLLLNDTRVFRPISRPRSGHSVPRIAPSLFYNYNPRHCRVTTHSHRTILCLGESESPLRFRFPFRVAKLEGQAKRAQWRIEDEVLPQMQGVGPRIAQEVRKRMTREGVTGSKEELRVIYSKWFNEAVSAEAHPLDGAVLLTRH